MLSPCLCMAQGECAQEGRAPDEHRGSQGRRRRDQDEPRAPRHGQDGATSAPACAARPRLALPPPHRPRPRLAGRAGRRGGDHHQRRRHDPQQDPRRAACRQDAGGAVQVAGRGRRRRHHLGRRALWRDAQEEPRVAGPRRAPHRHCRRLQQGRGQIGRGEQPLARTWSPPVQPMQPPAPLPSLARAVGLAKRPCLAAPRPPRPPRPHSCSRRWRPPWQPETATRCCVPRAPA
jgi:hypothetical protein